MQGGTLELHDGSALGIGTITVSGGWFQFRYNDQTVENNITASGGNIRCLTDSATITLNGDISVPSGAAQFGAGNSTSVGRFNINGTISGPGNVTFANGSGSCNAHFYLYGSNTYAGTTSMVGWGGSGDFTLGLGHNNCFGSSVLAMGRQEIKAVMPDVVIPNNVTLDNPHIVGTNNLTFGGVNTMPADRLFRIDNSALTTFNVIAESGGSRSLTKTGPGAMAISGTSTYTGTTMVDQGKFLVDGTLAAGGGTVTVARYTPAGREKLTQGHLDARGAGKPAGAILHCLRSFWCVNPCISSTCRIQDWSAGRARCPSESVEREYYLC